MSKFTFQNILDSLFTNTGVPAKSNKRRRGRTCRIEELEGREMLSATPWSLADDALYHGVEASNIAEYSANTPANQTSPALAPLGATTNSLSQTNFNAIRTKYADLNLAANVSSYHVIEIAANELSDDAINRV